MATLRLDVAEQSNSAALKQEECMGDAGQFGCHLGHLDNGDKYFFSPQDYSVGYVCLPQATFDIQEEVNLSSPKVPLKRSSSQRQGCCY